MKRPKAPKPTAQQIAVERRQQAALDKEIEEQEERFRAISRGQLGTKSLLGGVPGMNRSPAKPKAEPKGKTMLGMMPRSIGGRMVGGINRQPSR